jgi:hypothetical protein
MSKTKTHTEQVAEPINVVQRITDLLMTHGHPRPTDWQGYLHPDAFVTNDPLIQRFLVNRAWRTIIGSVTEIDTMDIRYCLVDTGDIDRSIALFEEGVLPCILQYQLPAITVG